MLVQPKIQYPVEKRIVQTSLRGNTWNASFVEQKELSLFLLCHTMNLNSNFCCGYTRAGFLLSSWFLSHSVGFVILLQSRLQCRKFIPIFEKKFIDKLMTASTDWQTVQYFSFNKKAWLWYLNLNTLPQLFGVCLHGIESVMDLPYLFGYGWCQIRTFSVLFHHLWIEICFLWINWSIHYLSGISLLIYSLRVRDIKKLVWMTRVFDEHC